jgi:hypothetical protein
VFEQGGADVGLAQTDDVGHEDATVGVQDLDGLVHGHARLSMMSWGIRLFLSAGNML